METVSERIKRARLAAGLNQAELGKACGISRAAVSQWELGTTKSPTPENLFAISAATGFSARWLATGKGESLGSGDNIKKTSHQNVSVVGRQEKDMPLLSTVSAGIWCESPDEFGPGDAEEWLPRPRDAGPRAFALRVEGDSMTSTYPGQRSYPHGCIVYVDPDRAVTNGCRVVARTPGGEYTFKTYTLDAGRHYLKPINPQYPMIEITDNVHICGVIFGAYMPE